MSVAQAVVLSGDAWGSRALPAPAGRIWRAVRRVGDWGQWGAAFVGRGDVGRGLASDRACRQRGCLYAAFWLARHGAVCGQW
eukprot:14012826-Alexandrium_andersonii.AAC.1